MMCMNGGFCVDKLILPSAKWRVTIFWFVSPKIKTKKKRNNIIDRINNKKKLSNFIFLSSFLSLNEIHFFPTICFLPLSFDHILDWEKQRRKWKSTVTLHYRPLFLAFFFSFLHFDEPILKLMMIKSNCFDSNNNSFIFFFLVLHDSRIWIVACGDDCASATAKMILLFLRFDEVKRVSIRRKIIIIIMATHQLLYAAEANKTETKTKPRIKKKWRE